MFARRFFSQASNAKIGFIGLGNMGGHMAANLIKKGGHSLVVFDVNAAAVQRAVSLGATAAASPAQVAAQAQVIVTMLPSSPHVQSVYLGANGILEGILSAKSSTPSFLLDSSTIDPHTTQIVSQALQQKSGNSSIMIDAPVSGGVLGAEAGTLTFMVGGTASQFERAKPILQLMGKNIVHCGDVGTGQIAKVCNNLILGISMAAVSEAMNLGVKLGMDPKVLAGIVNTSSGRCWSSDTYNPVPGVLPNVPSSRGYTGGFAVDLMKKDIGLALQAAEQAKVPLPLGNKTHGLYQQLSDQQLGGKDFSSIYDAFSKNLAK